MIQLLVIALFWSTAITYIAYGMLRRPSSGPRWSQAAPESHELTNRTIHEFETAMRAYSASQARIDTAITQGKNVR